MILEEEQLVQSDLNSTKSTILLHDKSHDRNGILHNERLSLDFLGFGYESDIPDIDTPENQAVREKIEGFRFPEEPHAEASTSGLLPIDIPTSPMTVRHDSNLDDENPFFEASQESRIVILDGHMQGSSRRMPSEGLLDPISGSYEPQGLYLARDNSEFHEPSTFVKELLVDSIGTSGAAKYNLSRDSRLRSLQASDDDHAYEVTPPAIPRQVREKSNQDLLYTISGLYEANARLQERNSELERRWQDHDRNFEEQLQKIQLKDQRATAGAQTANFKTKDGKPVQFLYPDPPSIYQETVVDIAISRARIFESLKDYRSMQKYADEAAMFAQKLHHPQLSARCEYYRGIALFSQKEPDYAAAKEAFQKAAKSASLYGIEQAKIEEWDLKVKKAFQQSLNKEDKSKKPTNTSLPQAIARASSQLPSTSPNDVLRDLAERIRARREASTPQNPVKISDSKTAGNNPQNISNSSRGGLNEPGRPVDQSAVDTIAEAESKLKSTVILPSVSERSPERSLPVPDTSPASSLKGGKSALPHRENDSTDGLRDSMPATPPYDLQSSTLSTPSTVHIGNLSPEREDFIAKGFSAFGFDKPSDGHPSGRSSIASAGSAASHSSIASRRSTRPQLSPLSIPPAPSTIKAVNSNSQDGSWASTSSLDSFSVPFQTPLQPEDEFPLETAISPGLSSPDIRSQFGSESEGSFIESPQLKPVDRRGEYRGRHKSHHGGGEANKIEEDLWTTLENSARTVRRISPKHGIRKPAVNPGQTSKQSSRQRRPPPKKVEKSENMSNRRSPGDLQDSSTRTIKPIAPKDEATSLTPRSRKTSTSKDIGKRSKQPSRQQQPPSNRSATPKNRKKRHSSGSQRIARRIPSKSDRSEQEHPRSTNNPPPPPQAPPKSKSRQYQDVTRRKPSTKKRSPWRMPSRVVHPIKADPASKPVPTGRRASESTRMGQVPRTSLPISPMKVARAVDLPSQGVGRAQDGNGMGRVYSVGGAGGIAEVSARPRRLRWSKQLEKRYMETERLRLTGEIEAEGIARLQQIREAQETDPRDSP